VQQTAVTRQNFVHEEFEGSETPDCLRQRRLVLDLPCGVFTPTSAVPELTPRLARDSADEGARTVPRDVNARIDRGLVVKVKNRTVMPYTDQPRAFLPVRVDDWAGERDRRIERQERRIDGLSPLVRAFSMDVPDLTGKMRQAGMEPPAPPSRVDEHNRTGA
jgi:hypothetical protein